MYLAAAPGALGSLRGVRARVLHAAYAVDAGGHLTRSTALGPRVRGGLMALGGGIEGAPEDGPALVQAIARECAARRYGGAVCDMERAEAAGPLWRLLGAELARSGRRLFVPEGIDAPQAQVLLCTAVSGGTLRGYLTERVRRYGAARCALDCERVMMDFSLPCPTGVGRRLSAGQLRTLRQSCGGEAFYSSELGARYFTYRVRGETHFVLYDDAQTLRAKVRLGEELGIGTVFFQYPEVCDLLPGLLS